MNYSLAQYLSMVLDEARWGAYRRAVAATVRPGDVVLDLGAGPGAVTGLALEAGAAHVYAVDLNPSVKLLREIVQRSGVADRVTVLHGDVRTIVPPRRVDVLIADLRGRLPAAGDGLAVLAHARSRWLAPGGRMVPQRDVLYAAPVSYPPGRTICAAWQTSFGPLDFSSLIPHAANERVNAVFEDRHLLAPGVPIGSVEYETLPEAGPFGLTLEGQCTADREGACDGVAVWFDATLCEGVSFSCGPGTPVRVYGQEYFPLATPIATHPGDTFELRLRAHPTGSEYLWFWEVQARTRTGVYAEKHSTWAQLANAGAAK